MDPQKLAEKVVEKMMSFDGFSRWLGIEVLETKPGFSKLRMKVRKEMLNGFGVCHGGIPYSIADSALAFASNSHGNIAVAIHNSIQYPESLKEGDVITVAAIERNRTRRLGFYDIEITKGSGERTGVFQGTVYRTEKMHFENIEGTK